MQDGLYVAVHRGLGGDNKWDLYAEAPSREDAIARLTRDAMTLAKAERARMRERAAYRAQQK